MLNDWVRIATVAICCLAIGYAVGSMHQYQKAIDYANRELERLCPPSLQQVKFNLGSPYIKINASDLNLSDSVASIKDSLGVD